MLTCLAVSAIFSLMNNFAGGRGGQRQFRGDKRQSRGAGRVVSGTGQVTSDNQIIFNNIPVLPNRFVSDFYLNFEYQKY